MALAAAYAAPFRASIWPAALKRTIAAKSAYPAAAPADSPVTPSIDAPFGVASNCAVKDPAWAVNGLFSHASELVLQPGCGACTVTVALPLCPSLVAVIVAAPAATPVTTPLELTVATEVLPLDQDTARPGSGVPFASFGVATSCTAPFTRIDAAGGLTLTDATGTLVTVMVALPLFPSLVAVIVADPVANAVTSPLASTPATLDWLDDQITARPERALPAASSGVAVSCTVCPTGVVPEGGVTMTRATGVAVPVSTDLGSSQDWTASVTATVVATSATRRRGSV